MKLKGLILFSVLSFAFIASANEPWVVDFLKASDEDGGVQLPAPSNPGSIPRRGPSSAPAKWASDYEDGAFIESNDEANTVIKSLGISMVGPKQFADRKLGGFFTARGTTTKNPLEIMFAQGPDSKLYYFWKWPSTTDMTPSAPAKPGAECSNEEVSTLTTAAIDHRTINVKSSRNVNGFRALDVDSKQVYVDCKNRVSQDTFEPAGLVFTIRQLVSRGTGTLVGLHIKIDRLGDYVLFGNLPVDGLYGEGNALGQVSTDPAHDQCWDRNHDGVCDRTCLVQVQDGTGFTYLVENPSATASNSIKTVSDGATLQFLQGPVKGDGASKIRVKVLNVTSNRRSDPAAPGQVGWIVQGYTTCRGFPGSGSTSLRSGIYQYQTRGKLGQVEIRTTASGLSMPWYAGRTDYYTCRQDETTCEFSSSTLKSARRGSLIVTTSDSFTLIDDEGLTTAFTRLN